MKPKVVVASVAVALLIAGCVQQPAGPMVAVMPAPYKPFDVFEQDQAACIEFANQQTAGQAEDANTQAIGTAALGTALGAGLGAALGGGQGAAVGAAGGALGGSLYGAGPADRAQQNLQQRYDTAYSQCMYARGNQVPGYASAPAVPPPPPPP
jgi:uncharacterized protein YcfJ